MSYIKSKKITLPLCICMLSALLAPALVQAELGGSGGLAASQAAEQRAAREKKLEQKKKDAEAKKAAEGQPAATQPSTETTQEKPAAQ